MNQNGLVFFFHLALHLLFRERRRGERGGEKHLCVRKTSVASCTPPTEDLAHNPGMGPDWESNWQPFGSQVSAVSTEPHPSGSEWFMSRLPFLPCVTGIGSSNLQTGTKIRETGEKTDRQTHISC